MSTQAAAVTGRATSRLGKAVLDRTVALAALVVLLPVLALLALAVLIDSGRPVPFRRVRVGEGGRPFTLLKFRTMVVGADKLDEARLDAETPARLRAPARGELGAADGAVAHYVDTVRHARVRADLEYLDRASFSYDLGLLVRQAVAILRS